MEIGCGGQDKPDFSLKSFRQLDIQLPNRIKEREFEQKAAKIAKMDWELSFGIDHSIGSFRERDIQLVRPLCADPATAIKSRIRPDIRKQRGFEQKAAKIAKMDWELGFGIDYSTRSFRERDIQLVRLRCADPVATAIKSRIMTEQK